MKAFSLVELSIVLVILGLLTGGILSGQSLIRAAELRAVTTEYDRYQAVLHNFKDKYFSIPGDMPNATRFWGMSGTCPGDVATPSTTMATCNGDGNGQIENQNSQTSSHEHFRFWQHLANAGLIEGTYTGVSGNGADNALFAVAGRNVPKSKFGTAVWYVEHYSFATMGNAFRFTAINPSNGNNPQNPVMKNDEAWNIDTKYDDGKPYQGRVKAYNGTCANAGEYDVAAVGTLCGLIMKTGF